MCDQMVGLPVITATDAEHLPKGVKVEAAMKGTISDGSHVVSLRITNSSSTNVTLTSIHTLAELHSPSVNQSDSDDKVVAGLVGPACETNAIINGINCKHIWIVVHKSLY